MMDMQILDDESKRLFHHQLQTLCCISDKEFVPPLSQRSSTTQTTLTGEENTGEYFMQMMSQKVLVCLENDVVLGFVSFRENYQPEHYPQANVPNIYISTLILAPESRGRGLTKQLYHYLFREKYADCSVYTRTWSQNAAHIKILSYFGFSELLRLPDHRGPGIDTVYFGLER